MWRIVKFKEMAGQDKPYCWRDETPERGGTQPKDQGSA